MIGSPPGRNQAIEGLRGLAATLVLISHIDGMAVKYGFAPDLVRELDGGGFSHLGVFGVCAFFAISGYLIVTTLIRNADLRRFTRNRMRRIYPLFLVLSVIAIPWALRSDDGFRALVGHPITLGGVVVGNLAMLPGVFALPIAQPNAWSLSYEFAFYLVAGLGYAGCKRRVWMIPALALTALMLVFRPYAWFFAAGVAAYVISLRPHRLLGWAAWGPVGLASLVAVYVVMPLDRSRQIRFASEWDRLPIAWQDSWRWPLAILLSTLFFLSLVTERGWLSGLLGRRGFGYLGRISYSLYLVHPFVLHATMLGANRLPLGLRFGAFALGGLAFSIMASDFSYRYIEVRLTDKLFRRHGKEALA